ncbi:copper chaperone PCu(A)C [Sphingomicrobium astaxanthinifaciens]|uniref:copper chaperone PCu(A)C n=1 Tax=Sphingomicrobium astaxanthinifaciens TaxID=1227949 RepID=UPI001FCBB459|nr:copper chaperone PCu(A)C [Sphingomicrobium astaxanthinifaciens]MCJ7420665.1 copper chaperone PCu(A)C [Sphingomicrobium astaxanthinifaciens]
MKQLFPTGIAALALAACSPPAAPEILLDDGWARASLPGQGSAAAYLAIDNRGPSDDRLVAVTSERGSASLHRTTIDGGMARMVPLAEGLALPAGERHPLEPQRDHVMLTDLDAPLRAGERFTLTLQFEKAGAREIDIHVVAPGER